MILQLELGLEVIITQLDPQNLFQGFKLLSKNLGPEKKWHEIGILKQNLNRYATYWAKRWFFWNFETFDSFLKVLF